MVKAERERERGVCGGYEEKKARFQGTLDKPKVG